MRILVTLGLLAAAVSATNNATATGSTVGTTLQPVFAYPLDGTDTAYKSTTTVTTSLDCRGSSLTVETFAYLLTFPTPTPTTSTTHPITTSSSFICLPTSSNTISNPTVPFTPLPSRSPTASPLPSPEDAAQNLINALRTAIIYASLISNGGFQDELCAALSPPALSKVADYNGTVIQQEVCYFADIQRVNPQLAPLVQAGNQAGIVFLDTALFAVQVAAGLAGQGKDLKRLCGSIEEEALNGFFIGFVEKGGTKVKDYVCGKAGEKQATV